MWPLPPLPFTAHKGPLWPGFGKLAQWGQRYSSQSCLRSISQMGKGGATDGRHLSTLRDKQAHNGALYVGWGPWSPGAPV